MAGYFRSIIPALLTGNGVVLKPSEYTPRSAKWFVDQLRAELPDPSQRALSLVMRTVFVSDDAEELAAARKSLAQEME